MSAVSEHLLAACLVWLTFPATAAELDIPGNYGNEAGCRHSATGNYDEDDMVLLTRREVMTYATGCSFVHLYPAEVDSHVAIVTYGHEGEQLITLGMMRVQKSPDGMDAYLIFDEDGGMWGKVERCR